jgi:hypothetical protein
MKLSDAELRFCFPSAGESCCIWRFTLDLSEIIVHYMERSPYINSCVKNNQTMAKKQGKLLDFNTSSHKKYFTK